MSFLDISWIPGKRVQPKPHNAVSKADAATIEQAKLDALHAYAQRNASQITFYPYDRGQCFDKNAQAVMAFVNAPGACAHYCWSTANKAWEFVQLPHMSTEQRCAERMGYMTIAKMRSKLWKLMDTWLVQNDFKVVRFAGARVQGGQIVGESRTHSLKDFLDAKAARAVAGWQGRRDAKAGVH